MSLNNEWDFVKVYTDEGITGTNTKKRDGFNQMVEDALNGQIDLIMPALLYFLPCSTIWAWGCRSLPAAHSL